MNKGILIALVIALAVGIFAYSRKGEEALPINEVSTLTPSEQKEVSFQESQATSSDISVGAIEQDLNNTVIQDEDFSDIEQ